MKTLATGTIRILVLLGMTFSSLAFPAEAQESGVEAERKKDETWQPRIVKLILDYASARQGETWTEGINPILPFYAESLETKPIKHAEKLYYCYASLLGRIGKRDLRTDWVSRAIQTPYNHVESLSLIEGGHMQVLRNFPMSSSWIWQHMRPLNELFIRQARKDRFAEDKIDRIFSFSPQNYWHPAQKLWNNKPVRIGDLWAEMNDFDRAIHAYQAADIASEVDTMLTGRHPMWEKMATLYERQGNWDMALNMRLKQLATASETDLKDRTRIQPRINQIIVLLAKIGAEEKVDVPATKHDLGKMRQIVELHFELGFPDEAMKVVEVMEKEAGKQLLEQRASVWEAKANMLFECQHPSRGEKMDMWVIVWNEVWTYDKVVAVHKEAIAWAKKAEWNEARIKKLEDQITKLPDLLKYIKEPKNWNDLLEGKAKEPVW